MSHPLHEKIADLIEKALKDFPDLKIIKDPACCSEKQNKQHIPLFRSDKKTRETRYCCVDLLILQGDKVRIIVEIEESNIKPTQVLGKFLTAALSNYYIHEKDGDPKEMADSVAFIQVLDSSKLKYGSVKLEQFRNLEKSIQQIIPLKDSRINCYKLFTGNSFDDMIDFIKTEVTS